MLIDLTEKPVYVFQLANTYELDFVHVNILDFNKKEM